MERPSAVFALLFGVVGAVAACGADQPRPPASASIDSAKAFVCRGYARPSVEVQPQPLEEIKLSGPGERSASSSAFRFRVMYHDDGHEGPALNTYVYSQTTNKLIEHSLFQLDRERGPVNQFVGGHGFTGLRYVYAPDSAAEFQYFCASG